MSNRPILIVVLAARALGSLRRIYRLVSRTAMFRMMAFFFRAAQFELGERRAGSEKQRLTMELDASASVETGVVVLERAAEEQTVGQVWYRLSVSRDLSAFGRLPESFALLSLATRTRGIVIDTNGANDSTVPRARAVPGTDVSFDALLHMAVRDAQSPLLTKAFYQSEIAPNDYLKRVCGLRKAVMVSLPSGVSAPVWERVKETVCAISGRRADQLFFLVEGFAIGFDTGYGVQPIEPLGFTTLERMALARNVDFLVSDRFLYILSALSKDVDIVVPKEPVVPVAGAAIVFDVYRNGTAALPVRTGSR
ncbi:MAG: hypothetical protein K2Y35_10825 [Burkholderiales bacterium]|nr:hypothetical protein [Burkholderiales bacterium]